MPEGLPLQPGDPAELGGHRLLRRLGEGNQGVVFLGRSPSGEPVAIKLLHARMANDAGARDRFMRELSAAKKVARFCTAQVLDADLAGDHPYIVSEYVDGRPLRARILDEGPRTGGALERLAIGTLTALAAIHRAGVVHRDFNPHNVLLGPDGPRVIDFGIARALGAIATRESNRAGTPSYMAPEQVTDGEIGPPADMFAWGSTIVFAGTGHPPFGNDSVHAVMERILHEEPDLSALPEPLRSVVAACLAKDPAGRPTAQQAQASLLGHEPGTVTDAALMPPPAFGATPAAGTAVMTGAARNAATDAATSAAGAATGAAGAVMGAAGAVMGDASSLGTSVATGAATGAASGLGTGDVPGTGMGAGTRDVSGGGRGAAQAEPTRAAAATGSGAPEAADTAPGPVVPPASAEPPGPRPPAADPAARPGTFPPAFPPAAAPTTTPTAPVAPPPAFPTAASPTAPVAPPPTFPPAAPVTLPPAFPPAASPTTPVALPPAFPPAASPVTPVGPPPAVSPPTPSADPIGGWAGKAQPPAARPAGSPSASPTAPADPARPTSSHPTGPTDLVRPASSPATGPAEPLRATPSQPTGPADSARPASSWTAAAAEPGQSRATGPAEHLDPASSRAIGPGEPVRPGPTRALSGEASAAASGPSPVAEPARAGGAARVPARSALTPAGSPVAGPGNEAAAGGPGARRPALRWMVVAGVAVVAAGAAVAVPLWPDGGDAATAPRVRAAADTPAGSSTPTPTPSAREPQLNGVRSGVPRPTPSKKKPAKGCRDYRKAYGVTGAGSVLLTVTVCRNGYTGTAALADTVPKDTWNVCLQLRGHLTGTPATFISTVVSSRDGLLRGIDNGPKARFGPKTKQTEDFVNVNVGRCRGSGAKLQTSWQSQDRLATG